MADGVEKLAGSPRLRMILVLRGISAGDSAMMGAAERRSEFYMFNLEVRVPARHLLRRDQCDGHVRAGGPSHPAGTLLQRARAAVDRSGADDLSLCVCLKVQVRLL